MECLIEAIFQVFGEAFIGVAFEWLVELLARGIREIWVSATGTEPATDTGTRIGRGLLWSVVGAIFGSISVLIWPEHVLKAQGWRILNVALAPVAMALLMVGWGKLMEKHHHRVTALNGFANAYLFALCFNLARALLVR